mgnify:CR=1 FL=1
MSEGRWVLFLLGGDLEDPRWFVDRATQRLGEAFGQTPRASRDHWTEPWGFQDHRLFLNRAVLIRTNDTPDGIMATALAIERELGRVRAGADRYAPRTIDIDVRAWCCVVNTSTCLIRACTNGCSPSLQRPTYVLIRCTRSWA